MLQPGLGSSNGTHCVAAEKMYPGEAREILEKGLGISLEAQRVVMQSFGDRRGVNDEIVGRIKSGESAEAQISVRARDSGIPAFAHLRTSIVHL